MDVQPNTTYVLHAMITSQLPLCSRRHLHHPDAVVGAAREQPGAFYTSATRRLHHDDDVGLRVRSSMLSSTKRTMSGCQ